MDYKELETWFCELRKRDKRILQCYFKTANNNKKGTLY